MQPVLYSQENISFFIQDCAFHPQRKLVAAGLVSGGARLLDCSGAEPSSAGSWDKHTDSCRSIGFGLQGNILFSASADRSIRGYDIESGKAVLRIKDAHDCAIERYHWLFLQAPLFDWLH